MAAPSKRAYRGSTEDRAGAPSRARPCVLNAGAGPPTNPAAPLGRCPPLAGHLRGVVPAYSRLRYVSARSLLYVQQERAYAKVTRRSRTEGFGSHIATAVGPRRIPLRTPFQPMAVFLRVPLERVFALAIPHSLQTHLQNKSRSGPRSWPNAAAKQNQSQEIGQYKIRARYPAIVKTNMQG